MAQTPEGALLLAARKLNMSLDEYKHRQSLGDKFCWRCRQWIKRIAFGNDCTRSDGLTAACLECRKAIYRKCYKPKQRPAAGRRFALPRDGDKRQARARANHLSNVGILPKPNTRPCSDCGRIWIKGGTRHEFDHAEGYAAKNQDVVEIVCAKCHHLREKNRSKKD